MVHSIKDKKEFDDFISSGSVVVDFFAEWCGPCKIIAPKFAEWAEEYTSVKFCKVNVDEAEEIASYSGVRAMPTFHFFKDGQKVAEVIGANADKIKEEIEKLK